MNVEQISIYFSKLYEVEREFDKCPIKKHTDPFINGLLILSEYTDGEITDYMDADYDILKLPIIDNYGHHIDMSEATEDVFDSLYHSGINYDFGEDRFYVYI